eukprot:gene43978-58633_t
MAATSRETGAIQNPAYRPTGKNLPHNAGSGGWSKLSAKYLKLRRDKCALQVFPTSGDRGPKCAKTGLESGVSNDSLSLTAYQYLKPVMGGVRPVPIDAHIVPWYPIHMLLQGACSPQKSGKKMVSPVSRAGPVLMGGRSPFMNRFLSNAINRIDAKGRVSVPATFRAVLLQRGIQELYCLQDF